MSDTTWLTPAAYDRLVDELEHLTTEEELYQQWKSQRK